MANEEGAQLPNGAPVFRPGIKTGPIAKETPKETFACPTCGRSFDTKQGLSMHITRSHKKATVKAEKPKVFKAELIGTVLDEQGYYVSLQLFLPKLGQEVKKRMDAGEIDTPLGNAFVALYLDSLI